MPFQVKDGNGDIIWMQDAGEDGLTSGTAKTPVGINPVISSYTHSAVSITTTSTTVIASNAGRKHLILINSGIEPVYIRLASAGATIADIPLNPAPAVNQSGGSYEITNDNLYRGAIVAITATGSSTLRVIEGV